VSDQTGPVRFVHALAEFRCDRCGGPCLQMCKAPVGDDGRVGPTAEAMPGPFVCNDCEAQERAKERAEYNRSRQQDAWARKARKLRPK
jgi:hypothetical protein